MEDPQKKCQTVEYKDKKIKVLFQGQYTRSQHWLKLDPYWIEEYCMTRDPDSFKSLYQKHIPLQSDKDWDIFFVTIGS